MRRWGSRPTIPALFDITRLRAIGEWGDASRHLGTRWEELGLALLGNGVDGWRPRALLPVCNDTNLQSLLAATGSKNPDIVGVLEADRNLILQPADFKWSLDVASYRQISADVLRGLLDRVAELSAALRALLPPEVANLDWTTRDGIFISPKTEANRRFLGSPENKRQEYPIESTEVLFVGVEPIDFFDPLPGWQTARELARLDGSTRGLPQIDTADRYYHLGAGVAGALVTLERSIFDEATPVEPTEEVERLRAYLKTISPPATGVLIDRLGSQMRYRRQLIQRLRDLTRQSFGFVDFVAALTQAGLASENDSETALRRQWSEAYRCLIDEEDAQIRAAGREIRARGETDVEALEALERRREVYARRLRVRAKAIILSNQSPSPLP